MRKTEENLQLYLQVVKKLTSSEGFCRQDLRDILSKQGRKERTVPPTLQDVREIFGEDPIKVVGKLKSRFMKYYINKYDSFTAVKKVLDYFNLPDNTAEVATVAAPIEEASQQLIMPTDLVGYDIARYAKTFNISVSDINPKTLEWFKDQTIPRSVGLRNTIYLLEVMKPFIAKGNNDIPISTIEDNLKRLIGSKQKFNLWYYLYVIYVVGECPKVDFITGTARGFVLVKNLGLSKLEALQRRLFNKMPETTKKQKHRKEEIENKIFKNSNKLRSVDEVYVPVPEVITPKEENKVEESVCICYKRDVCKIIYAIYALLKNDGQTSPEVIQTLLLEKYGLNLEISLIKAVMLHFSKKYGYFNISDNMIARKKSTALLDEMAMQHKYSDIHNITIITLKNEKMLQDDLGGLPVEKIGSSDSLNVLSFKMDIENPEQRDLLFLLWLRTEPRLCEKVILPDHIREIFEARLKGLSGVGGSSKFSIEIEEDLRLCETL